MKTKSDLAVLGGLGLSLAVAMAVALKPLPVLALGAAERVAGEDRDAEQRQVLPGVVAKLLEMPRVAVEDPDFVAHDLVKPGSMFDPLFVVPDGSSAFYVSDDGDEDLPKDVGGHIWHVDLTTGKVEDVMALKSPPPLGIGLAPKNWGKWGGQIIALTQAHAAAAGAFNNHLVRAFDPKNNFTPTTVCELPVAGHTPKILKAPHGDKPEGTSSIGIGAGFGLPGGSFEHKFYAVTNGNNGVYQTDADGKCTPFFLGSEEKPTAPFDLAFVPKGTGWGKWEDTMLISTSNLNLFLPEPVVDAAEVTAVDASGKIVGQFAANLTNPGAMAFAPAGFGNYGGDLFVADAFQVNYPVHQTQQERRDGVVYRYSKDGQRHVFATGLVNPFGLRFVGNTLVVTDINGDFLVGKREIPDGFVVAITPKK
jgi:hypothetical protein